LLFNFKNLQEKYFSRTLEERLGRAMTAQGNMRWTPLLEPLTRELNNSVNSSIDMIPSNVNLSNAPALFDYVEQKRNLHARKFGTKLKLGDIVRIPLDPKRTGNLKAYLPKWSKNLYQIVRAHRGTRAFTFDLIDAQDGTPLDRRYYDNELNLVLPLSEM